MQANGKFNRGDKEVITFLCGVGVFFLMFLYIVISYI